MGYLHGIEQSQWRAPDAEDRAYERNAPARDYADAVTDQLAAISEDAGDWSHSVYRGDFGLPLDAARREQLLEDLSVLGARIKQLKGGA